MILILTFPVFIAAEMVSRSTSVGAPCWKMVEPLISRVAFVWSNLTEVLPQAEMILPQLGSLPVIAVLTSASSASVLANVRASACVAVP